MRAVVIGTGVVVVAAAAVAGVPLVRRAAAPPFDPLARAATETRVANREAPVPPACSAVTDGGANGGWPCYSDGRLPNAQSDWELQKEYSFSDTAKVNHWLNSLPERADARAAAAARISDGDIVAWI